VPDADPALRPGIQANLAAALFKGGQVEQSLELYRTSISGLESALGPSHPKLAVTLEYYANLVRKSKRNQEARAARTRAAAILAAFEAR
jgi:hypothetical protein